MPLLDAFSSLSLDDRKARLEDVHPLVSLFGPSWTILLDAYEGAGGFLTGDYLWKYPNELQAEFHDRQRQARYHNYAKSVVNLYVRYAFSRTIDRQAETALGQRYLEWTQDVDGAGTSLTEWLKRHVRLALAVGQQGVLVDKTKEAPTGPTVADQRARVVLRRFGMTGIRDWRHDSAGNLVALKLAEAVPNESLFVPLDEDADETTQYLLWDREFFVRLTASGDVVGEETQHNLGVIPFELLRPEPSAAYPFLGQSLLGNANVLTALFNRGSEEDNVLRTQAFSILTVQVANANDVEDTKKQIGNDVGTTRAIVSSGEITYQTPDMECPKTLRESQQYLVNEILRAAHMRVTRDSLQAETAEAIRLQHAELNEMLQGLTGELARIEQRIARLWFAWEVAGGAEASNQAFLNAKVQAAYPDEFFVADMAAELDVLAKAVSLDFGPTLTKTLKKTQARALAPDLPDDQWETVDQEIDAQTEQPAHDAAATADALRQRSLAMLSQRGPIAPTPDGVPS